MVLIMGTLKGKDASCKWQIDAWTFVWRNVPHCEPVIMAITKSPIQWPGRPPGDGRLQRVSDK